MERIGERGSGAGVRGKRGTEVFLKAAHLRSILVLKGVDARFILT